MWRSIAKNSRVIGGLRHRWSSCRVWSGGQIREYEKLCGTSYSRGFPRPWPYSHAASKWLTRHDSSHFNDGHLFEELQEAASSLHVIAKSFSPDAIISHAYEGGHLDHEACSFLAMHVGGALSLRRFEFPLYWIDAQGKVVLQKFRDTHPAVGVTGSQGSLDDVMAWQLDDAEIQCKKRMMAEYRTQSGTVSTFRPDVERFRPATTTPDSFRIPQCRSYLYQNRPPRFYHTWRHRLPAKGLLKKFVEFEDSWRLEQADA